MGADRVKTPADIESVARVDSLPVLEPKLPGSGEKPENTAPIIVNNDYEEQIMNQSFGLVSQLILDEFSPRTRVISKINNQISGSQQQEEGNYMSYLNGQ